MLLLVFLFWCQIFTTASSSSSLSPNTLVNTDIACQHLEDCRAHFNHSWCKSGGVLCLHRFCKLIPEVPCKSTQQCLEEEQRCLDRSCTSDAECDNGIFCDGVEICEEAICIIDPERPNCHYLGGLCDEEEEKCYPPRTRLAWRLALNQEHEEEEYPLILSSQATPTNNVTDISQTAVNISSVIIIAIVVGVLFILVIIWLVARSIGGPIRRY